MAPNEFTKVVLPTGLLSVEEGLTVHSYISGDEVTRLFVWVAEEACHLNSTQHAAKSIKKPSGDMLLSAPIRKFVGDGSLPFLKHCLRFKMEQTQDDDEVWPDYLHKKIPLRTIYLRWPIVNLKYREHHDLNFIVSVGEYLGTVKEENFTVRFQKELLNCKEGFLVSVALDPPVEMTLGRTYSVVLEDCSTSVLISSFRKEAMAYLGLCIPETYQESNVDFEDVGVTLKGIQRKTDYRVAIKSCLMDSTYNKILTLRLIELNFLPEVRRL